MSTNVAGALEPCGCTPDQLGGLDHLGAWLADAEPHATATALLAVGSLAFGPASANGKRPAQDQWKAETLVSGAAMLNLAAWTPGPTDLAQGPTVLGPLGRLAQCPLLGMNVTGGSLQPSQLVALGRLKVGLLGVTTLAVGSSRPLPGSADVEAGAAAGDGFTIVDGQAPGEPGLVGGLRAEAERLQSQGAELLVLLAATGRGDALRIAEAVPSLNLVAVADPNHEGAADDEPVGPELVGTTLVVQAANHLQTVAVVDIYLAEERPTTGGALEWVDLGGIERATQAAALTRRIRQLELRLGDWSRSAMVPPTELAARRADLERLRVERDSLEQPDVASTGRNGFRFRGLEIREQLGREPRIAERFDRYYRKVNEHNRTAYQDRLPPPLPEGEAGYVGVAACTAQCHQLAKQFWSSRPHARAYETLRRDAKEFNLECVGCHVTGYERPGGSTVTHNESLQAVQCEECHGPGSLHQAAPNAPGLIVRTPEPGLCAERCHHPPHVVGFDPAEKTPLILGPGHGAT